MSDGTGTNANSFFIAPFNLRLSSSTWCSGDQAVETEGQPGAFITDKFITAELICGIQGDNSLKGAGQDTQKWEVQVTTGTHTDYLQYSKDGQHPAVFIYMRIYILISIHWMDY